MPVSRPERLPLAEKQQAAAENRKEDRKDRRLAEHQTGKRRCVVVMRERRGRTPAVRGAQRRSGRAAGATVCRSRHHGLCR